MVKKIPSRKTKKISPKKKIKLAVRRAPKKIKRTPKYLKPTVSRKKLPALPDTHIWALKTLAVVKKQKFIRTSTVKTRKKYLKQATRAEYRKAKARITKKVKGKNVYYTVHSKTVVKKISRAYVRKKKIGEVIRWVKEKKQHIKIKENWSTYQGVENDIRKKYRMSPDGEVFNVLRYDERSTMPDFVELNSKFGYNEPQLPLDNFVHTALIVWALMKVYSQNYVVVKFPMKLKGEYSFTEIRDNFLPSFIKKIKTVYRRRQRQFLSIIAWTAVGRPKTKK